MGVQAALEELPGVLGAGAAMASPENLRLLDEAELLPAEAGRLGPGDLLVTVRAGSGPEAEAALAALDGLLAARGRPDGRAESGTTEFRPRTLASAVRQLPGARWVLVSVPGRYAGALAREAIVLGRHVFLFSDGVSLREEIALKRQAAERALLVMGPDCGTALIGGVGFGFANAVRRGSVGIVSASGTGLQAVSCALHRLGVGVSHSIGTGGRDLNQAVGGTTAHQALDLLGRDPTTEVIVLLSKPPAPEVAARLLQAAARSGKPVVVHFQGTLPAQRPGLVPAATLEEAARMAVALCGAPRAGAGAGDGPDATPRAAAPTRRGRLIGLFGGGTLAAEAALALRDGLVGVTTNFDLPGGGSGESPRAATSWREATGHLVLDLGADDFTAGRPHPMIDPTTRVRLLGELGSSAGAVLLDVVLGYGAHPDPAGALAPAVCATVAGGAAVAIVLIGTADDPQGLTTQKRRLQEAGAAVFHGAAEAARWAAAVCEGRREPSASGETGPTLQAPGREAPSPDDASDPLPGEPEEASGGRGLPPDGPPVALEDLKAPVEVIAVGVDLLRGALRDQNVPTVGLEWAPPAGGDERLAAILGRLRG